MTQPPRREEGAAPQSSGSNPFRAWREAHLPPREDAPAPASEPAPPASEKPRDRGRVDVIRQTAHRGGKAVTVITNFRATSDAELRELASRLRKACGSGGTVKDGSIEIQGEKREAVKRLLEEAGYQPVFAGG
ncbi:MAG: translation initiation factor [Planctomycetes bacterium]|nr:translation initiation factor [Planctomycetota bacterium]